MSNQLKEAKRLLLNQKCSNCIFFANPYRTITTVCVLKANQHIQSREYYGIFLDNYCEKWITSDIFQDGFSFHKSIHTLNDAQLFRKHVKNFVDKGDSNG